MMNPYSYGAGPINLVRRIAQRYLSRKRKYPVSPEHADQVPIYEYVSKPHRRKRVYLWGCAKTGALGIQQSKKREMAERIEFLTNPKRCTFAEYHNVKMVACGFGYSLFGLESSKSANDLIYGCGLNHDSQLGYHDVRHDAPLSVLLEPRPIHLQGLNLTTDTLPAEPYAARQISCGRAHAAVLTERHGLFMLGNNAYGQCGRMIVEGEEYNGSKYVHRLEGIGIGEALESVECGQDHSLVVTKCGEVFGCGWGADGQTGLGHFNTTHTFSRLEGDILNERIVKVACKADFVLALSDRGELFGWGNTEYSQITLPDGSQQVCDPRAIKLPSGLGRIVDIAAGGSFCVILNEAGDVFVWGFGILGLGPSVQSATVPRLIPAAFFGRNQLSPDMRVASVRCGLAHLAAVTTTGDLYMWGRNRNSCLGLGSDKDQYFPLKVSIAGKVESVSCGLDHSIAVCKSFITE